MRYQLSSCPVAVLVLRSILRLRSTSWYYLVHVLLFALLMSLWPVLVDRCYACVFAMFG